MKSEFDELVDRRSRLIAWRNLSKTSCYDAGCHVLRVDIQNPTMVAYCGQQYSGAKNYHDAPAFFAEAITKQIKAAINDLTKKAYDAEIERLTGLIEQHKKAILAELDAVPA